jgi:hypothetical protein
MNRNALIAGEHLAAAPGFTSLSDEELTLIAGGGIWDAVGDAVGCSRTKSRRSLQQSRSLAESCAELL